MTVHLLLSGLVAGVIWRITRNGWLAGLYWLGATYLLGQIGRPEELGLLFGTMAIVARVQPNATLAGIGRSVGRGGLLAPVGAVIATAIVVCRLGFELGLRPIVRETLRWFVAAGYLCHGCAGMLVCSSLITVKHCSSFNNLKHTPIVLHSIYCWWTSILSVFRR